MATCTFILTCTGHVYSMENTDVEYRLSIRGHYGMSLANQFVLKAMPAES